MVEENDSEAKMEGGDNSIFPYDTVLENLLYTVNKVPATTSNSQLDKEDDGEILMDTDEQTDSLQEEMFHTPRPRYDSMQAVLGRPREVVNPVTAGHSVSNIQYPRYVIT